MTSFPWKQLSFWEYAFMGETGDNVSVKNTEKDLMVLNSNTETLSFQRIS